MYHDFQVKQLPDVLQLDHGTQSETEFVLFCYILVDL